MSGGGYAIGEKSTGKLKDPRFWQCLALVLGVIALVLLIVVIVLAAEKKDEENDIPECRRHPVSGVIDITEPENPPIFHDLTRGEIRTILDFMLSQKSLNITKPSKAVLASNYVYAMELILPEKKYVLQSTQQTQPTRKALVTVFCGGKIEPNVEEYCVELTQQPSFCGGPKSIPFSFRPITIPEYMSALNVLTEDSNRIVGDILRESFKGSLVQCGGNCLGVENVSPFAAVIAEVEGQGFRGIWFPLLQLMEPKNLHPVDFAVLVTINGSAVPETADVWYNGQSFVSLQEFKDKWDKGEVNKLNLDFPQMRTHDQEFPENLQRPPIEIEPDGKRYSIKDQTVTYMNWKFHYGISPTHGPQLYNIRFKNDMIVYELGLQEICVFYSSSEPAGRFTNYFDTVVMIRLYMKTLVPGIDCPSHATFLDATHMFETSDSPVTNKKAICVFEHNSGSPLRRHHAPSETPSGYYEGAPNVVLILRMIGTLVNYDYIFDFIFYQNGVLETKVTASGIIVSSFKSTDKKYGFQLTDQALGTLHFHFFNFKVDLDIGGSNNSYATYEVEADEVPNPFSKASNPSNWHQEKIVKVNYATEREATYKYNFSTPKYHVFYNENNKDKYGNPKAYRLLQKGMAKNVRTQGAGNEPGSPWTRYQMVVTKRKESEPYSSSKYATYDGENRKVNFEDFIGEENINGEDLVAWVTLGVHHIPHSEDLPIMPTPGTDLSFLLLPFNYFPEDPSVGFHDNVRLQYDSPSGPLKVKKAKSAELNCLPPKTYSIEDLIGQPEAFINRS